MCCIVLDKFDYFCILKVLHHSLSLSATQRADGTYNKIHNHARAGTIPRTHRPETRYCHR